jgi:transposase-like protein
MVNIETGRTRSEEDTEAGVHGRVQGTGCQAIRDVGIAVAARELGLVEQTLRNWAKAFAAGKLNAPGAKPIRRS